MEIDWQNLHKVLVVRLRSIGDTVLATPSLIALREFLPNAQIDILLEDWVAPVLKGFDVIDNVLIVSKDMKARLKIASFLRKEKYDLAINLHGGTTATFFVRASGAKHRNWIFLLQLFFFTQSPSFVFSRILAEEKNTFNRTATGAFRVCRSSY